MSTWKLSPVLAICFALTAAGNAAAQDCDGNGIPDSKEVAANSYLDSNQNGKLDVCEGFSVDLDELSLSKGGVQRLHINLGKGMPGRLYWVLGSTNGTGPGLNFGGVKFPLSWDGAGGYMIQTLKSPNDGYMSGGLGFLDATGQATATFNLPAGMDPMLAGVDVYHAYVLLSPDASAVVWSSNAVRVELRP